MLISVSKAEHASFQLLMMEELGGGGKQASCLVAKLNKLFV